jgi:AhpD family alkylhydroperoxidase
MPKPRNSNSSPEIRHFERERAKLNKTVFKYANLNIKRLFHLDTETYKDGALPAKTKEMLGLVASLVLRCDDCIRYHLLRCREAEVSDEELAEVLNVGLVVGGSITIPHLRRAFKAWDDLKTPVR